MARSKDRRQSRFNGRAQELSDWSSERREARQEAKRSALERKQEREAKDWLRTNEGVHSVNGNASSADVVCHGCGKTGHIRKDCPVPPEKQRTRPGGKSKRAPGGKGRTPDTPEQAAAEGKSTDIVVSMVDAQAYTEQYDALLLACPFLPTNLLNRVINEGHTSSFLKLSAGANPEDRATYTKAFAFLGEPVPKLHVQPPAPQVEPAVASRPLKGPWLTSAEFAHFFEQEVPISWVPILVGILSLGALFDVIAHFAVGRDFTPGIFSAHALAMFIIWTALRFWIMPRDHYHDECRVFRNDDYDTRDIRIRSNAHVTKLDKPIQCHRYTFTLDPSRTVKPIGLEDYEVGVQHEWTVVDHWAAVALSEFSSYRGDSETFLKNVHTRYLRCAEMNVSDEDYEEFKVGTTAYLAWRLAQVDFPRPGVRAAAHWVAI